MGSDLSIEYGPERTVNGVTRRLADTSERRAALGFSAEIDLEEGLTQLVEWWRGANGDKSAGPGLVGRRPRADGGPVRADRGSAAARQRPSPR